MSIFHFLYLNSCALLSFCSVLSEVTADKYTHRWGFVIQAAGLVYQERSWPNDTSPHEVPNEEINPGFTPGSGETLFRLSPHTHTQKVCHALFSSYATGFL